MVVREWLESEIEMAVCHFLASKQIVFWKQPSSGFFDTSRKRFRKHTNPYVLNGVPDLLLIIGGRLYGFEIKTKVGRQSDSQKAFQQKMIAAGAQYFLIRSLQDAKEALQSILEGKPATPLHSDR